MPHVLVWDIETIPDLISVFCFKLTVSGYDFYRQIQFRSFHTAWAICRPHALQKSSLSKRTFEAHPRFAAETKFSTHPCALISAPIHAQVLAGSLLA